MNRKKRTITSMTVSLVVFSAVIPLTLICVYCYINLSKNIRLEYEEKTSQFISGLDKNLEIYFNEIKKTTDGIVGDDKVQNMLIAKKRNDFCDDELIRDVDNYLSSTYGGRGDISRVSIYSNDSLICEKNYFHLKQMYPTDEEIFENFSDSGSAFTIIGARYQSSNGFQRKNVITVGRQIKNLNDGEAIGYLIIDINYNMFKKMLGSTKDAAMGDIVVVNKDGNIIYNMMEGKEILQKYEEYERAIEQSELGSSQDIIVNSNKLGWTYHVLSDGGMVLEELNKMALYISIIGVVAYFILIVVAVLVASGVSKPIKRLDQAMEHVGETGFDEIVSSYSSIREISHLIQRYNTMQVEIQSLMDKEKALYKKQSETEYKALQMQITPHFLYNALDSINCLAEINHQNEISEMVRGLGSIFKYNIKYDYTKVTLRDEVNHVKNYGLLQAIRYQDAFDIIYDIDEKYMEYHVTKFMLQPIVENAINHGMQEVEKDGHIRITAETDQKYLFVIVEDNGNGMTKEKEATLRDRLSISTDEMLGDGDRSMGGIGLINVNIRLKLQYGLLSGISFETIEGKGTKFIIRIPRKDANEMKVS